MFKINIKQITNLKFTFMKKSIYALITVLITIFVLSCGQSEESIRREMKLKMESKLSLQDSVKTNNNLKLRYEQALSDAKGELEVAKDRLARIEQWKFGRTPSEREEQIKEQTISIGNIEKYIGKLQNGIPIIESKIANFESQLLIVEADINK